MVAFKAFFSRFSLDVLGFSASALCAIHCIAMPVILVLSAWQSSQAHSHHLEGFILVVSAAIGSASIIPAYLRHHRKARPVILFLAGLVLIFIGRFHISIVMETIVTVGGALLVASSHYLNWRFCKDYHALSSGK